MVDFQKGATVIFAKRTDGISPSGWRGSKRFEKGTTVTVTMVRRNVITVRGLNPARNSYGEPDYLSFNVPRDSLEAPNGEAWSEEDKPKIRPVGQVPEGSIAPDDPRIAWIWEDAARVAKSSGHCWEYDQLVDRLGGIGRERNIEVTIKVGGISIKSTVKARSAKEAKQIVLDNLDKAPATV